jgi:hypothetical protein
MHESNVDGEERIEGNSGQVPGGVTDGIDSARSTPEIEAC